MLGMSVEERAVYDPDPTELQLQALRAISTEKLQTSDLTSPQVVQLLILNQQISLAQLKEAKSELAGLQRENSELKQDRENLRVDLAGLRERINVAWLEIPIGIATGFAINMLTSGTNTTLGWFLLLIGVVMLLYLRAGHVLSAIRSWLVQRSEERSNE